MGPLLTCGLGTVAFIAPFYLSPWGSGTAEPRALRFQLWRLLSFAALAGTAWLPLRWALPTEGLPEVGLPPGALLLRLLGLHWAGAAPALAIPLGLTALLLAGPLSLAAQEAMQSAPEVWTRSSQKGSSLEQRLYAVRANLIGPLVEEFVFRAWTISLLLVKGWRPTAAGLASATLFAAAHAHHLFVAKAPCRSRPLSGPTLSCRWEVLRQCAYTGAFGLYAAFLFLRTGHLLSAVAAHVLCNWLEAPDLDEIAGSVPATLAALAGLACFCLALLPWTRPELYHPPGVLGSAELVCMVSQAGTAAGCQAA